jgi:deoxyadenosine/deoxycytidine kinase
MNSTVKYIISLEGNIGAGKSSFLKILKQNLSDKAEFIDEPVDEWLQIKNNKNENLLEVFYQDKKRWAYTFQNIAYITRMKRIIDIMQTTSKSIIFMDRSLEGDLNTFTKMLKEDGDIDNLEWSAYKKWNTMFTDLIGKNIQTRHIYLRCTPEIAYERISKRARNEENSIPFEYIKQLHLYHDNWLLNNTRSYIIDVNKDFVYDEKNKDVVYQLMLNTLGSILN